MEPWIKWTKKILVEEGHSLPQLVHILQLLARHPTLFYPCRALFVPQIVHSLVSLQIPATLNFLLYSPSPPSPSTPDRLTSPLPNRHGSAYCQIPAAKIGVWQLISWSWLSYGTRHAGKKEPLLPLHLQHSHQPLKRRLLLRVCNLFC